MFYLISLIEKSNLIVILVFLAGNNNIMNTKKIIDILLLIIILMLPLPLMAQGVFVKFKTKYGQVKVMLYDYTPQHKEMFLNAIKNGVYRSSLFNRIVKDFVVQGGEHDDAIAIKESKQRFNDPRLLPEFDERAFHKIGALGAGRDDNPEKASFLNQIYFVVGKTYTAAAFDSMTVKYNKQFSIERRNYYMQHGGQPRLDGDYTVFGEVVDGLDVLLKISQLPIDKRHNPLKKVKFKVKVLSEL